MSISMRMRIVGSAKNQKMEKRCTVIVHCVWMCFFVVVMVQEARRCKTVAWYIDCYYNYSWPCLVWSGLAGCWLFPLEPRFVRYKLFCASLTTAILRTSQNNRQYVKHSMFRRRRRGCRQIVGVCVCNSLWCLFTEMLLMEHVSNFKMFTNWLRSSAWGSFMFLFHCPAPPLCLTLCAMNTTAKYYTVLPVVVMTRHH